VIPPRQPPSGDAASGLPERPQICETKAFLADAYARASMSSALHTRSQEMSHVSRQLTATLLLLLARGLRRTPRGAVVDTRAKPVGVGGTISGTVRAVGASH
jgi:hypothetical protein